MANKEFFPYKNQSPSSKGSWNPHKPASNRQMTRARNKFWKEGYLKKPASKVGAGIFKGAFGAASLYFAHKAYGDEYGGGAATAYGLAAMNPIIGTAMMIGEIGVATLSYGHSQYHERRRLNLGSPVHDQFGTLSTMRQRSLENLSRGRAALGNEGRLHHF